MSNKLLLGVIAAAFIAGGICGGALKSLFSVKSPAQIIETRIDTVVRKIPVKIREIKYLTPVITPADTVYIPARFTLSDSIRGTKDDVEYSISHKMEDAVDSVKSIWDISLFPLVKEFAREKIITELREVEVPLPFYRDGWFWVSFAAVPLLLLAIIF